MKIVPGAASGPTLLFSTTTARATAGTSTGTAVSTAITAEHITISSLDIVTIPTTSASLYRDTLSQAVDTPNRIKNGLDTTRKYLCWPSPLFQASSILNYSCVVSISLWYVRQLLRETRSSSGGKCDSSQYVEGLRDTDSRCACTCFRIGRRRQLLL